MTITEGWRCRTHTVHFLYPIDKWDMPLFEIRPKESLPFDKIAEAVLHGHKPKNPLCTKKEILVDANYMYELDSICQGICASVLKMQSEYSIGDSFIVPDATKTISFICLPRCFSRSPLNLRTIRCCRSSAQ
eukprot:TRINITY_DN9527_c0_g5_i1.p2 TRINITY_DN9527_c0_g5~~TRINITY_DN9527_c0_g5_i1.p2  ORF type:complete len:132 (-),score=5.11 TRINITY_DN9527_c0_g5_i1:226-621(-)